MTIRNYASNNTSSAEDRRRIAICDAIERLIAGVRDEHPTAPIAALAPYLLEPQRTNLLELIDQAADWLSGGGVVDKQTALEQIKSAPDADLDSDVSALNRIAAPKEDIRMLDGKQLRALFQQFNKEYFDGRLPAYCIRVVPRMTALGESGRCNKARRLIEIQSGLPGEETISTLLHQMAHAVTRDHHSLSWKKAMIRLRMAGAPLASADLDVDPDDWDGLRVRRSHFRRVIQYVLTDVPDMTLSAAIRHFIYTEGGAATITEFLKKCPWAGQVFQDEKRERRTQELRARHLAMPAASKSNGEKRQPEI
jgi:hypothetical protein